MPLSTADRIEIEELISRLCHAFDFSQPADVVAAFVPDGAFQLVSSVATGMQLRYRHQGHDQLRAFAEATAAKRQGRARHWTGNLVVTGTPDGAEAVSYTMLLQIDPETGQRDVVLSAVHRDVFARTGAGWRFVQRTVVADA
jgi:hypothetical protein